MIYAYCDGACEPANPGGWGVGGWVLIEASGVHGPGGRIGDGAVDLGHYPEMTNNIAEYGAVHGALKDLIARKLWGEKVVVRTDSQLVVNQLNMKWSCFKPHLVELRDKCLQLAKMFSVGVTFEWVPRAQNEEADEMSRSLYHGFLAPGMPKPDYERPKKTKRKR